MSNKFRWSLMKGPNDEKDYFSTAIFSSRPNPSLTEEEVLKIPTVLAAVELISNSIAQLPIYLYSEGIDGSIIKIKNDSRLRILNESANEYETSQTLKKKLVKDYLLHGRAYILKRYDKLFYLEASKMQEELYTEDSVTIAKKSFIYNGHRRVELEESEVLVIDSGTNGLLVTSELILKTALECLTYQNSILKNSAIPLGILKASTRLTEGAINRLRKSWERLYQGTNKSGTTIILEEGLDFQPLSMSPEKIQMHETNKQLISEIARTFSIPESMLNSSANKYNSLEQNNLNFLQYCVSPIITAIESSLDKSMLLDFEKVNGYYFRFDISELLRTTEKEKIETTVRAMEKGLISINEARAKIDLPRLTDDYFTWNLGSVFYDTETGKMTIPNMGMTLDPKTLTDVKVNEDTSSNSTLNNDSIKETLKD